MLELSSTMLVKGIPGYTALTQSGLVMTNGDIDLSQHYLRWWLKAISWTKAEFSSMDFWATHQRPPCQEFLNINFLNKFEKYACKITSTSLRSQSDNIYCM